MKKDIPCHQQGKQDGEWEGTASVVDRVVTSVTKSVVVKLLIGMSGTVEESAVTAAEAKHSVCVMMSEHIQTLAVGAI